MGTIEPDRERLQAFLTGKAEGPVVMINLLRYREQATYPEGAGFEPCSGREAYARYGEAVREHLEAVGGRPLWFGSVVGTVIAPEGEVWDDAILVEYPSREAFLRMVERPEYQAIAVHRSAALADSRLIATRPAPQAGNPFEER